MFAWVIAWLSLSYQLVLRPRQFLSLIQRNKWYWRLPTSKSLFWSTKIDKWIEKKKNCTATINVSAIFWHLSLIWQNVEFVVHLIDSTQEFLVGDLLNMECEEQLFLRIFERIVKKCSRCVRRRCIDITPVPKLVCKISIQQF